MIAEIYGLFRKTLPEIIRSPQTVEKTLQDPTNYIISTGNPQKPDGISVVNKNIILLLCVDSARQNEGIGTYLLQQSEAYISTQGYNNVIIGAGEEYIMPGVPMNNGAHNFFEKRGYTHSWGDTACLDMSQNLDNYSCDISIGDVLCDITYRWATAADIASTVECVTDAWKSFVQYYKDETLYEPNSATSVLIAEKNGEVLGTLMVSQNTEGEGIGAVGCTTTKGAFQGRGIATTLVKLGTKHLKEAGLRKGFLGYTYTDIVGMYARAGYEVCMEYFMAEKQL